MGLTKWALLCGGDFYFEGTARDNGARRLRFPNLAACTQDVEAMYDFLVDIGVCPANMIKLTATPGDGRPIEDEASWPTRQNIVRELERIAEASEAGDLVYIHYSGHGIRRSAIPPDPDGDSMNGAALVMTDVLIGGAYLTAYHLGVQVKGMVQKGLRVTLVLDCCYSGRGLRDEDFMSRTIPDQYDDSWLPSDADADAAADAAAAAAAADTTKLSMGYREPGSAQKPWLSNPTGCTVILACGPHESAREGRFGDSAVRHGALTYYMLNLLRTWGSGISSFPPVLSFPSLPSHVHVIDYVRTQFQNIKIQQSPHLLGDGNYEVFGAISYIRRPLCRVTANGGSEIHFDVGSAQGVAVGALYDVLTRSPKHSYLYYYSTLDAGGPPLQARVTEVSLFRSTATLAPSGSWAAADGRKLFAARRRWALPNARSVTLATDDVALRAKLGRELESYTGLRLGDDGMADEHSFAIEIDQEENTYEIFQAGTRLPRLPRIYVDDTRRVEKLARILWHVGRFQALRQLSDIPWRGHLKEEDFALDISSSVHTATSSAGSTSSTGNTAANSVITDAIENEKILVSLSYGGQSNAYVSLYCFTSSWGILKVDPQTEEGKPSSPIWPNIPIELDMTMKISPKTRLDDPLDVTDTFMAFVSSSPDISWDEICMRSVSADDDEICEPVNIIPEEIGEHRERSNQSGGPRSVIRRENLAWGVLEQVVRTSPKTA